MNCIIYTDGSCLGNPGPGGWSAVIVDEDNGEVIEIHGGEKHTTNNRMEMTAAISALNELPIDSSIEIYTDSSYLKNAFTKGWISNWKRNGWKTANRTAVLNQDLWIELDQLINSHRSVKFNFVKGHSGDTYNERCDKLAREEATHFKSSI